MRRLAVIALLAACGSAPPPPPYVVKPTPPPPPPPPACITPPDEGSVAITHAVADGTRVLYCLGGNPDQCFALDTASGAFEKLRELPMHDTAAGAHVETTNPDLKVCQQ